ncbi:MAG: hypothetical protein Q9M10_04005 [Mariprofundaceae bacterium]|nr:hypothetical protein [Mariprofundaceae bacterium]
MLQRLMLFTLSALSCVMILTSAEAFELTMDEQLPAHVPSAVTAVQQNNIAIHASSPVITQHTPSLQWWWLLAIPAVLLLIGIGWLLGLYMERRTQAQSMQNKEKREEEKPLAQPKLPQEKNESPSHLKTTKHDPSMTFDMLDVHKAYRCFLFTRDESMLNILEQAFRYDPYDLNPYLMSIRILSESERPLPHLERLLRTGIFLLRSKNKHVWKEVSQHGKEFLPTWNDWFETEHKATHV